MASGLFSKASFSNSFCMLRSANIRFSRWFSPESVFISAISPRHCHSDQWRSNGSTSIPPYFARHL
jgi:hypothetical protein